MYTSFYYFIISIKVYQDLFNLENETEMDHIGLSRWADLIFAPATANTISKLANGNSDDLASTVTLASNKKIFIAPAMNVRMWEHQSTKENIDKLKTYNYKLIGPWHVVNMVKGKCQSQKK